MSLREQISKDIASYLKSGGRITVHQPCESGVDQPIKRTRKEQVEWCRKHLRVRRNA